jgi:hypothetical protein
MANAMNTNQSRPYRPPCVAPLLIILALVVVVGGGVVSIRSQNAPAATPVQSKPSDSSNEIAQLRAEVDRLKGLVPDQAHAMADVGYHYANLWFAGERTNWPLAEFYWAETRSHLRWAVRIIPIRKDTQGNDIRLSEILDPIDRTALQQVGDAIKAKDSGKFAQSYRQMLDSCYACHLTTGKPYLRLQIPQQPEAPNINFTPEP